MTDRGWTDDARTGLDQDELGRSSYAIEAAKLIAAKQTFESSIVFGISGPWGSGKSSLVNMIVDALQKQDENYCVARFTPWATHDVAGLVSEFYAALGQSLPPSTGDRVRAGLGVLAAVAAPTARLIPLAGEFAGKLAEKAEESLKGQRPWDEIFRDVSKRFEDLNKPILVVVDDIDRLQPEELLTLLKVVRLLGRFPGVQYLLAYDDETLYRSLNTQRGTAAPDGSAERFMEKIVQYPLVVPPLLRYQQMRLLREGLGKVAGSDLAASGRFEALVDCFLAILATPRAIDRFIAQLEHHLPLVPAEEIDQADFVLLTLLRVSVPGVFNALPGHREQLLSGATGMRIPGRDGGVDPFDIGAILDLAPERLRAVTLRLLISLFPKVLHGTHWQGYPANSGKGASVEGYFDRYFAMSITDNDVSDLAVAHAIREGTSGRSEYLKVLLTDPDADRVGLAITKLEASNARPATDGDLLALVRSVAEVIESISPDGGWLGSRSQALYWIGSLVSALNKGADSGDVVEALAFKETTDLLSVWYRVQAQLGQLHDEEPAWAKDLESAIAERCLQDFVRNLRLGDKAAPDDWVGEQRVFLQQSAFQHEVRERVAGLVASGEVTLADVAARVVVLRVEGVEPNIRHLLGEPEQSSFDMIAPPGDDPWYALPPVEGVEPTNVNWPNRRLFAQGKLRAPV